MIPRSMWGAQATPFGSVLKKPATSVTVHHPYPHKAPLGASSEQEIKEVKAIHKFHKSKWLGIGYNFIVTQNGNVYEGRGWGRQGAHAGTTEGNETSYGIAFLIDGNVEAPTTLAQLAFRLLRNDGVRLGHLTADHALKFHHDWHATNCPGPVLEAALRAVESPKRRVLRFGMRGDDVKELQALLEMDSPFRTGYFGVKTGVAVRNFQLFNGIEVDGIVGEKTWRKLRE